MKKILVISLVLASFSNIHSQTSEIEKLSKIRDELVLRKNEILDSIKKINLRINYLESIERKLISKEITFTETKTTSQAKIRNEPSPFGEIIGYVPKGDIIKVFSYYKDGYWQVEKDSLNGYTSEQYIAKNEQMKSSLKNRERSTLIKKYGQNIVNKIDNHQIWIGMTQTMARLSIGNPKDINSSTGSWGVHEQWIYNNRYLYFENGKLTSFQNH